jgi:hypothetical protein
MDVKISPMRPTLQKNKQESWNPIHAITDNYIVVDKPPAIPTVPPRDLGNTGLIPHFLRQVRQGQVGPPVKQTGASSHSFPRRSYSGLKKLFRPSRDKLGMVVYLQPRGWTLELTD